MSRRVPAPAATYEQELLTAARNVARLQAKRRRYRRLLRELDAELRHERKMLKAIAGRNDERRPDVAPSRLTHGATGYVAEPRGTRAPADVEPFDIGDPLPAAAGVK